MRRLLRIPDQVKGGSDDAAYRLFSTSMILSALRCLLTYIFLPGLSLIFSTTTTVAPLIGIPLAIVALVFDVLGIRRFWVANHQWRWYVTFIYLAVMVLVTILLIGNIESLLG